MQYDYTNKGETPKVEKRESCFIHEKVHNDRGQTLLWRLKARTSLSNKLFQNLPHYQLPEKTLNFVPEKPGDTTVTKESRVNSDGTHEQGHRENRGIPSKGV